MAAGVIKFALAIFVVFTVKKPQFTNANSICYSFHLEEANDVPDTYFTCSFWKYFDNIGLAHLQPRSVIKLLLILASDVEICPGPTLENLLQCKGFAILRQNIRGLVGKKDLLVDILFNHSSIDILGLSETWTTPDCFYDLKISGYKLERRDRLSGIGGGVGAYTKDSVPYIRRYDLEREDCETLWLEVCFKCSNSFLVAVLYRPPGSKHLSDTFESTFENVLSALTSENKEVVITRDLNCDYLRSNVANSLKKILFGLKQLVNSATRITDHSSTLIDIILTTEPVNIIKVGTILSGLSDHDMVGCIRKINKAMYKQKVIYSRNYKNYDSAKINNELESLTWDEIYESGDPDIAPFTQKRVRGKPCMWLTEHLKSEMRQRYNLLKKARKSQKEIDWSNYNWKRNSVNNQLKTAKEQLLFGPT